MNDLIPSGDYREFYPLNVQAPVPFSPQKKKRHPFLDLIARLLRRREVRAETHKTLPMLWGALCGTLAVTLLCLSIPLTTLIAPYRRQGQVVTIPDFEGKEPSSVLSPDAPFHLIIRQEINPSVPEGLVISQSPSPGVRRTLKSKEDRQTVVLTVSKGQAQYTLADLQGLSRRSAELILANEGMVAHIVHEYSSGTSDTVLGTIPAPGTSLAEGQTVTLRICLGEKPLRAYVPNLCGLSQSAAYEALRQSGLPAGSISYASSSLPVGTVMEQELPAHSLVPAETAVGFRVSLGEHYEAKTVPDLYGLSTEQAILVLHRHGLAAGNRYTVSNPSAAGTVMTQSPLPGTPIDAALYSVDLYVSSG